MSEDWGLRVAQVGIVFMIFISILLAYTFIVNVETENVIDCEGNQAEINITETANTVIITIDCIPGKEGVYLGE